MCSSMALCHEASVLPLLDLLEPGGLSIHNVQTFVIFGQALVDDLRHAPPGTPIFGSLGL